MTQRMREDWYRLLSGVHYLGYHTFDAMSYNFDDAQDFSLVTSNQKEVKEALELLRGGGMRQAAIWVIEGHRKSSGTQYYLREVFHPTTIEPANPADSPGARKKFDWRLDGKGQGQSFGRDLRLNGCDWFPAFLEDNGNFGFGLRALRDQDVKDEFLRLARPHFEE
ncbi:hypothetical protein HLB42_09005 [Deinococcus sp. D7000]|nr:hypothetical protein HLB42_09005 [Deinococcus sp. D7000]